MLEVQSPKSEVEDRRTRLEKLTGNWFLASACTWRCAGEGEWVFGLTKHDAFLESFFSKTCG